GETWCLVLRRRIAAIRELEQLRRIRHRSTSTRKLSTAGGESLASGFNYVSSAIRFPKCWNGVEQGRLAWRLRDSTEWDNSYVLRHECRIGVLATEPTRPDRKSRRARHRCHQ